VPFADTSVYKVPEGLTDDQVLFLADIMPTAYEVGVLNGRVVPGDTVAIVGAGPIGLAAIMTARLHTPGRIVAIDLADSRLEKALEFGADVAVNNGGDDAIARVQDLTGGEGADVAIEAVGVPETFELCTELVRPGGRVANVGVHGHSATLHLERLWIRDVMITTGLVDTNTTPRLLKLIEGGRLDPTVFATHRFSLAESEGPTTSSRRPPRRTRSRSCSRPRTWRPARRPSASVRSAPRPDALRPAAACGGAAAGPPW
jgi:alcohol dehydrogenase